MKYLPIIYNGFLVLFAIILRILIFLNCFCYNIRFLTVRYSGAIGWISIFITIPILFVKVEKRIKILSVVFLFANLILFKIFHYKFQPW